MKSDNRSIEKSKKLHRGFTLIEMLVVIGIIAILVGASIASFSKMMATAEKTKAQELVKEVATALTAIYEADGMWPGKICDAGEKGGILDEEHARVLGKKGYLSLSMANDELTGKDRFGILTPWAAKVVERKGRSATKDDRVNGNTTVEDHILHFAVDVDGDGIIEGANVGGETIPVIRATAAVWCVGKSGGINHNVWPYSTGVKKDDVYSWTDGQATKVE